MAYRKTISTRGWALSGCAVLALAPASLAHAQQAADAGQQLQEVVVTATRQSDTVNRVPLSVTAQTQQSLDQQGIKTAADLQATVPALSVSQARGPGVANLTIRGISDLQAGAPTTGFYLDDTSLSKRATASTTTASGNGSPIPPLFDLERVEVLRGPQGTLYGGSSEGGTVRYITPTPSLTRYSTYIRGEVSKLKYGGTGYEGGVAVGGPIIQDKLGFRASVFYQHSPGWQDYINQATTKETFHNANSGQSKVIRLAVTWAPVEQARITLAVLASHVDTKSNNFNGVTLSTNAPIVVPTVCFNTSAITPARFNNNPTPVACNSPGVTYSRPGFTLPQLTLGPDDVAMRGQQASLAPLQTNLMIPTLTLDYDFPHMSAKSITSIISDDTKLKNSSGLGQASGQNSLMFNYGAITNVRSGINYIEDQDPTYAQNNSIFYARNERYAFSQEFRLSSAAGSRLSWVTGVYYANNRVKSRFDDVYNELNTTALRLYGITVQQRYGIAGLDFNGISGNIANRVIQTLKDVEIAAFGEANYWIVPDKLRATAGIRVSRLDFSYTSLEYGAQNGLTSPFLNPNDTQPLGAGASAGSVKESPVTPKFGLQYQLTDSDMFYVSAAKGFRPGGVTQSVSPGQCNPTLINFGLSAPDVPTSYKSDSVWSYEGGAKLRMLNRRLQLNTSVYRIDWTNVQLSTVACGGVRFTTNAGAARSQGVEVEAQAILFRGLTANVALGYTDAKFTTTAIGIPQRAGFSPLISAVEGQKLPVPPLTINIGGRYDHEIGGVKAYFRGDFRFTSKLKNIDVTIFPVSGYAPDNVYVNTKVMNLRAGIELNGFDINIFANNVFNYHKGNVTGLRGTCATPAQGGTAACTTYTAYNPYQTLSIPLPRVIGLQVAYRN